MIIYIYSNVYNHLNVSFVIEFDNFHLCDIMYVHVRMRMRVFITVCILFEYISVRACADSIKISAPSMLADKQIIEHSVHIIR